jgi:hypothetical protein
MMRRVVRDQNHADHSLVLDIAQAALLDEAGAAGDEDKAELWNIMAGDSGHPLAVLTPGKWTRRR